LTALRQTPCHIEHLKSAKTYQVMKMSDLESVPVRIEAPGTGVRDWGNALPILHEIRHGLQQLADGGEPTVIDLGAIPFGPGDEERLLELLGRGEVDATLNALGPTRAWETSIPGVWLVDHHNADDERIALHIEIAGIPDILRTQSQDLREAVAILDSRIATADDGAASRSQGTAD
jgi:hydrogenase-1 operon protein HyaF